MAVPTLSYGCKAWAFNVAARQRLEAVAVAVSCFRAMCGMNVMQRIQGTESKR